MKAGQCAPIMKIQCSTDKVLPQGRDNPDGTKASLSIIGLVCHKSLQGTCGNVTPSIKSETGAAINKARTIAAIKQLNKSPLQLLLRFDAVFFHRLTNHNTYRFGNGEYRHVNKNKHCYVT